jgi:hypothetical protein
MFYVYQSMSPNASDALVASKPYDGNHEYTDPALAYTLCFTSEEQRGFKNMQRVQTILTNAYTGGVPTDACAPWKQLAFEENWDNEIFIGSQLTTCAVVNVSPLCCGLTADVMYADWAVKFRVIK